MDILTCGIVDDDPQAVHLLNTYLSKMQNVRLLFKTNDATEALAKLRKYQPDILFLDVEMPELTAFDLIKWVNPGTKVVLCTAHRQYAYDGFEHRVADFLLKPVDFARFFDVVTRLRESQFHAILNGTRIAQDYFLVNAKDKLKNYKILFEDILYMEAVEGGVKPVLREEEIMVSESLTRVYRALPKNLFVRISNAFVIGTEYYKNYANAKVYLYHVAEPFPISRMKHLAKDFFDWLNEHKL